MAVTYVLVLFLRKGPDTRDIHRKGNIFPGMIEEENSFRTFYNVCASGHSTPTATKTLSILRVNMDRVNMDHHESLWRI
jgi:hypothetical protein